MDARRMAVRNGNSIPGKCTGRPQPLLLNEMKQTDVATKKENLLLHFCHPGEGGAQRLKKSGTCLVV